MLSFLYLFMILAQTLWFSIFSTWLHFAWIWFLGGLWGSLYQIYSFVVSRSTALLSVAYRVLSVATIITMNNITFIFHFHIWSYNVQLLLCLLDISCSLQVWLCYNFFSCSTFSQKSPVGRGS